MWQAFRNGSVYDLSSGEPAVDDPHGGHPWGPERTVRARIVALLLLDGPPALPAGSPPLKLTGAQISGSLDLAGGTVEPYVELRGCRFEQEVRLPEARFTTAAPGGLLVPRLEAARLHTEGDLHLPRCRFHNGIRLTDAHDRHRPAAEPGDGLPRPQRPLDRRRRHHRRPGPPGRVAGVARRDEPARRDDRRVAEPAGQPAEQPVRAPRAERAPVDRRAHAVPDAGRVGSSAAERHDTRPRARASSASSARAACGWTTGGSATRSTSSRPG